MHLNFSNAVAALLRRPLAFLFCLASISVSACAQASVASPAHLTIDVDKKVSSVSPTLYGLMSEEINHSYEGGLYAELLKNRTFRSSWAGMDDWYLLQNGDSQASLDADMSTGPSTALSYSAKLTISKASAKSTAGLSNSGYWGLALQPHTTYKGSFYAKMQSAKGQVITVRLVSDITGEVVAKAEVPLRSGAWSHYRFELSTGVVAISSAYHFELLAAHPGTLWLQLASLFPPTFHNRPNGNRVDLMLRMAAMHPKFLRLPGGNYLEGDTLADWYNWKQTLGPLVDRPGHQAPWSYWSTDGLGLLEFLEWCEDQAGRCTRALCPVCTR